jgi:hypothetical protein
MVAQEELSGGIAGMFYMKQAKRRGQAIVVQSQGRHVPADMHGQAHLSIISRVSNLLPSASRIINSLWLSLSAIA